jgi:hypothetical protein
VDANLITALAAALGSVTGASAAIATTLISQKSQTTRERAKWETRKRETLYGDFITEASRLIADAFDHSLDDPETLVKVYANLGRISGSFRPTPFYPPPKNVAIAFLSCTHNPTGRRPRSSLRYTVANWKCSSTSATLVALNCVSIPHTENRRARPSIRRFRHSCYSRAIRFWREQAVDQTRQ